MLGWCPAHRPRRTVAGTATMTWFRCASMGVLPGYLSRSKDSSRMRCRAVRNSPEKRAVSVDWSCSSVAVAAWTTLTSIVHRRLDPREPQRAQQVFVGRDGRERVDILQPCHGALAPVLRHELGNHRYAAQHRLEQLLAPVKCHTSSSQRFDSAAGVGIGDARAALQRRAPRNEVSRPRGAVATQGGRELLRRPARSGLHHRLVITNALRVRPSQGKTLQSTSCTSHKTLRMSLAPAPSLRTDSVWRTPPCVMSSSPSLLRT